MFVTSLIAVARTLREIEPRSQLPMQWLTSSDAFRQRTAGGSWDTYIHYITLHYITLHYITLHYITLHYITYVFIYLYL